MKDLWSQAWYFSPTSLSAPWNPPRGPHGNPLSLITCSYDREISFHLKKFFPALERFFFGEINSCVSHNLSKKMPWMVSGHVEVPNYRCRQPGLRPAGSPGIELGAAVEPSATPTSPGCSFVTKFVLLLSENINFAWEFLLLREGEMTFHDSKFQPNLLWVTPILCLKELHSSQQIYIFLFLRMYIYVATFR